MGRRCGFVLLVFVVLLAISVDIAGCSSQTVSTVSARRVAAPVLATPHNLTAGQLRARPGAVAPGTTVSPSSVFTDRVFANARDGFALANEGSAQYPVRSIDGGRVWRIAGPQFHIDAADGAEGVGYVGIAGPRMFFAYGSSVVDVTVNAGRTWWETFLGELVVAVVPGGDPDELVAYVQRSLGNQQVNSAVTWQYVTHDGGHRWSYSTALGGAAIP